MLQGLSGEIVTRKEWGAREPKLIEKFPAPAPYVVIHHSYLPSACYTNDGCSEAMRSMQDFHQLDRGWNDLGYSFAIGGNGLIYHGRGFNVIGAHAPKYNDKSVGICLIGDWSSEYFMFYYQLHYLGYGNLFYNSSMSRCLTYLNIYFSLLSCSDDK